MKTFSPRQMLLQRHLFSDNAVAIAANVTADEPISENRNRGLVRAIEILRRQTLEEAHRENERLTKARRAKAEKGQP